MGAPWIERFAPTSEIQLTKHSGRVGAVDALNWVTKMATGVQSNVPSHMWSNSNGNGVAHVIGTISGVRKYIRSDIPLIFIYDGEFSSSVRQMTDPGRSTEATPYPQSRFFKESTAKILDALGIPFIKDYPFDGEAGAAVLNRDGYADFVLSNDWDTLLFGAEVQIRDFTGQGSEVLANRRALEAETGFSQKELVDIAILVGTDYNDGLQNVSAESAMDALEMYGSLEAVYDRVDDPMPEIVDDLRDLFLDPPCFEGIDSALLNDPPIPSPNLDTVEALLAEYGVPSQFINRELDYLERAVTHAESVS
ncbi:hypothetical protein [Halosolutus halophilus]|uniref:hypothetical protein n=1 Tax=Halosolutus halophilus TaxID=1552990 RepID=UPI002234F8ED|nr:hypothetical protein [Halosolutus halophilus]